MAERPQNLRPARTAERTHNSRRLRTASRPEEAQSASRSYRGGHRDQRHRADDSHRNSGVDRHHAEHR